MKVPYTKIFITISMVRQIQDLGQSVKVQTETFFQKGLTGFKEFFLFRVPMNPLQA